MLFLLAEIAYAVLMRLYIGMQGAALAKKKTAGSA